MKIAIFSDTFIPQKNGVVSYVVDLASELANKKHDILVCVPHPGRKESHFLSNLNFKTEFIPSVKSPLYPLFRNAIPALPKVLYDLQLFKPDIVHLNDPFTVCMDGLMAAKILHIPVVFTFHTFFLDEDILKNIKWGNAISIIKEPLSRLNAYIHNQSDVIICPSIVAQKELRKYGLTKPSMVVHNSVDLRKVIKLPLSQRIILRKQYHLEQNSKVGLFVGRLSVDKSVDILIESWKYILEQVPAARLLIIGSGPLDKELLNLSIKLGISDKVIFTGPLEREDIMAKGMYYLADLFLTASKIENQSVAMIEAMAHGLPIVAVDARGNNELVTDNGFLIEGDNPVALAREAAAVYTDPILAKQFSVNSLKNAKEYSLQKMVVKVENIYNKLRNNRNR